jgi:hypothetical protein
VEKSAGEPNVKKKPTHQAVKNRIVRAVMQAYEQAYAKDKVRQAKKPAIMKKIDAHFDKILRPLFTVLLIALLPAMAHAQCLPIPNGDTRALVDSLVAGRPFGQQTLLDIAPTLALYGIQLTPPNAAGERTKIGDPISGRWIRLGFGEKFWVWIPQGDVYQPIACPPIVSIPPPVVTPPPVVVPPPLSIDISAILAKMDELEREHKADTDRLEAAINQPGWLKNVFSNKYVQMALAGVSTWIVTKAAQ